MDSNDIKRARTLRPKDNNWSVVDAELTKFVESFKIDTDTTVDFAVLSVHSLGRDLLEAYHNGVTVTEKKVKDRCRDLLVGLRERIEAANSGGAGHALTAAQDAALRAESKQLREQAAATAVAAKEIATGRREAAVAVCDSVPAPSSALWLTSIRDELASCKASVNPSLAKQHAAACHLLLAETGTDGVVSLSPLGATLGTDMCRATHDLFTFALTEDTSRKSTATSAPVAQAYVFYAALGRSPPAMAPLPAGCNVRSVWDRHFKDALCTADYATSCRSSSTSATTAAGAMGANAPPPVPFPDFFGLLFHRYADAYSAELDATFRDDKPIAMSKDISNKIDTLEENMPIMEQQAMSYLSGGIARAMYKKIDKMARDAFQRFFTRPTVPPRSDSEEDAIAIDIDDGGGFS